MAINFPDSPILNDEFTAGGKSWYWNGSVWKAKQTTVIDTGKYTVSETAPLNPSIGDGWFNSTIAKEFIFYDNYWIETSAAAVGLPSDDYATVQYVDTAVANVQVDLTGYATETYVGTQISNLVDAAPATLDTLNELAAALNDDANFATTVTNSLATKSDIGHTHVIADITDYVDPNFNLDGGIPSTNYGGIIAVDGGSV